MPITNDDLRERAMLDELALVHAREVTVVVPASGKASEARVLADGIPIRTAVRITADVEAEDNKTRPFAGVIVELFGRAVVEVPPLHGRSYCFGCGVEQYTNQVGTTHKHRPGCPMHDDATQLMWESWRLGHREGLAGRPRTEDAHPVFQLGWERGRLAYLARRYPPRWEQPGLDSTLAVEKRS